MAALIGRVHKPMAIDTTITTASVAQTQRSRADSTKQIAKTTSMASKVKRTIEAAKTIVETEIKAVVSSPFNERNTGPDVMKPNTSSASEIENAVAAFSNPNTSGRPTLSLMSKSAGTSSMVPTATTTTEYRKLACLMNGMASALNNLAAAKAARVRTRSTMSLVFATTGLRANEIAMQMVKPTSRTSAIPRRNPFVVPNKAAPAIDSRK